MQLTSSVRVFIHKLHTYIDTKRSKNLNIPSADGRNSVAWWFIINKESHVTVCLHLKFLSLFYINARNFYVCQSLFLELLLNVDTSRREAAWTTLKSCQLLLKFRIFGRSFRNRQHWAPWPPGREGGCTSGALRTWVNNFGFNFLIQNKLLFNFHW